MPWLPKQPNRLRSEQADPVLPHSHDSRSVTSERHLWIAHLSISATKTNPKFKLSTQLQLLKNVHFIENHLIYWSPTLWWQTSRYSCNPAAIAYVLVSWQLSDSSVMFANMPALSPALITHQTRPPHTWIESHFWHQCRRRSGGGRMTCIGVIAATRTTTTGRSAGTYQLSRAVRSTGFAVSTLTLSWYWWTGGYILLYGRHRRESIETGAA